MKKEKVNMNLWNRIAYGTVILVLTALVSGCDTGKSSESMSLEELLAGQAQAGPVQAGDSQGDSNVSGGAETDTNAGDETVTGKTVWVHICGEVAVPGIYELPADSRFYDALMAAGGFTENANTTYFNLVSYVSDGMQIEVPLKNGVAAGDVGAETGATDTGTIDKETRSGKDDGLVNINTATKDELQKLPGIGATRAQAIIEYRQKNGEFQSTEQIMEVSGIKEATFEKIKDLIKIE